MKKRVVLAMSGGVDSSVAAYFLKRRGYSVIGVTFKMWSRSFCGSHGPKSCCSLEAINDARSVCAKLKIPHYALNCEDSFKKEVIDYFIRSYREGLTPNPCIICNEKIKFPILLKKAKETDSGYIATGHHARSMFDKKSKRFLIKEGKDKNKDQSYVLFSLTQEILSHLILPVGDFMKAEIRAIAKRLKLKAHQRKESQEICFILDNNLKRFLRENLDRDIRPGHIKDKTGKVIGEHEGSCFFTIGQRKGLRIPFSKPLYVVDIRPRTGDIIVGDYKDTLKTTLTAKKTHWFRDVKKSQSFFNVEAKIRYKHPKSKANVKILSSESCEASFLKPQSSPTPGQAVVFYKNDTVLGGGWIQSHL